MKKNKENTMENTNPNNYEVFKTVPYNFYSPYIQMYMQALAARPPIFFFAPAAQPGAAPAGAYGYDPYGMQPVQPAVPAKAPEPETPVIRRRVRQKAVILFAGLFALAALALSAFFFYVNGSLIPDFFGAFGNVSGFGGYFEVLGNHLPVLLLLAAAVLGLGTFISALVGLCCKKWQPVVVFAILAFVAYAAACAVDYMGDGLFRLLVIKEGYPYYCVGAAYLFSMVLSWFCYPKRKFVLQEI
jgi:hypothetical protein